MGKAKPKEKLRAKKRSSAVRESKDDLVFKALANVDRRRILDLVRESPRTTSELTDKLNHLNRCTVMQHLKKLEESELIIVRREGKFRWNYLNVEPVQQIYSRWIQNYAQPAAELLVQLKEQLESR